MLIRYPPKRVKSRNKLIKRVLLVLPLLVLYSNGVFAGSEVDSTAIKGQEHTIRNTYWGMSSDDVMEIERWDLLERRDKLLRYKGKMKLEKDVEMTLTYYFHNDILVRLGYSISGNKDLYLFFYKALWKKYNFPIREVKPGEEKGGLTYAMWVIHDGQTIVSLRDIPFYGVHSVGIMYINKKYDDALGQLREDKERDAFFNIENDL